jgi:hypothetical protein
MPPAFLPCGGQVRTQKLLTKHDATSEIGALNSRTLRRSFAQEYGPSWINLAEMAQSGHLLFANNDNCPRFYIQFECRGSCRHQS